MVQLRKAHPKSSTNVCQPKTLATLQNFDDGQVQAIYSTNRVWIKGRMPDNITTVALVMPKSRAYTLNYDDDGSFTWYMYAKLKHSSRSRRSPQPPHPLKPA